MTDVAVRVDGLGKLYRLGTRSGPSSLREALGATLSRPFRSLRSIPAPPVNVERASRDWIWALRNVSFEVPRGQILGIIGPNGAGKSTLLKVLSRIVEPTEGRAEIHGRVGCLLEVGTGFHPELTGRENIYLSGALLGMRKAEIDRKLDEIIAFAEIERFIETPVKRYSSGMYVRLAFAVAAHLEPEVLIVDEVLAVGDVAFQRKCLSKMEDVRQHGRTILFVSHNMPAVTRLCQRALLVSDGRIRKDGLAADVTSAYVLDSLSTTSMREWPNRDTAPGNELIRLRRVRVCDDAGSTSETADIRRPIGIEMTYEVIKSAPPLVPYYEFFNEAGLCIFVTQDLDAEWRGRSRPPGTYTSVAWIPGNLLAEGALIVGASIFSVDPYVWHFHARDTVAFHVVDSVAGDSARGDWDGPLSGAVRPLLTWTTVFSENASN